MGGGMQTELGRILDWITGVLHVDISLFMWRVIKDQSVGGVCQ